MKRPHSSGQGWKSLSSVVLVSALWGVLDTQVALAGPPGSPGYCPGDGLMHDWDSREVIGPCPRGGGVVRTKKGNVWVDPRGKTYRAPTVPDYEAGGPHPDKEYSGNADAPTTRPMPIPPGTVPVH